MWSLRTSPHPPVAAPFRKDAGAVPGRRRTSQEDSPVPGPEPEAPAEETFLRHVTEVMSALPDHRRTSPGGVPLSNLPKLPAREQNHLDDNPRAKGDVTPGCPNTHVLRRALAEVSAADLAGSNNSLGPQLWSRVLERESAVPRPVMRIPRPSLTVPGRNR